ARNRVRSSLSAFFNFAIREGLIEINPVAGTGKADEGHSRDRTLSQTELRNLLTALGTDQFSDVVRLLILTGQRREENGGILCGEGGFGGGRGGLPPARNQNKRFQRLALSRRAE